MACEQTERMAPAYSGGGLEPLDAAQFEQHMLTCGECTAEVAGAVVLDRSLRGMRTHFAPSPEFAARVMADVRKGAPKNAAAGVRKPWFFRFSLPVFSAAAIVILALLSSFWWRQARNAQQDGQLLAELSDIHAATLASANPVDIVSTNRHVVKPWFEGKVPFAFNVPELQNTGFSLDGGRLIYLRQQPGAELLLHYGPHRCSLFIFRDGPMFSRALSRVQAGAFHVETLRQDGLILFVIGNIDQQPLRSLGQIFASAQ